MGGRRVALYAIRFECPEESLLGPQFVTVNRCWCDDVASDSEVRNRSHSENKIVGVIFAGLLIFSLASLWMARRFGVWFCGNQLSDFLSPFPLVSFYSRLSFVCLLASFSFS
jgi:hypothetical protein